MSESSARPAELVPDTGLTIGQCYIMVGLGAFVTTIAQPGVIGRLPFALLLKNQLHFNAETLAGFMFIATFAWNEFTPISLSSSEYGGKYGWRNRRLARNFVAVRREISAAKT